MGGSRLATPLHLQELTQLTLMLRKEKQKGEKKENQTYCPTNNCSTKYAYNYHRVTKGI